MNSPLPAVALISRPSKNVAASDPPPTPSSPHGDRNPDVLAYLQPHVKCPKERVDLDVSGCAAIKQENHSNKNPSPKAPSVHTQASARAALWGPALPRLPEARRMVPGVSAQVCGPRCRSVPVWTTMRPPGRELGICSAQEHGPRQRRAHTCQGREEGSTQLPAAGMSLMHTYWRTWGVGGQDPGGVHAGPQPWALGGSLPRHENHPQ